MNLDSLFFKKYNKDHYNCAHFVRDAWLIETGVDITKELEGFLMPARERNVKSSLRRVFKRLKEPVSPCIVLMQRPRSVPHVGIYLRGKVLHLHEKGAERMTVDIATRGFNKVGFYTC